jgi:hypothetical protein
MHVHLKAWLCAVLAAAALAAPPSRAPRARKSIRTPLAASRPLDRPATMSSRISAVDAVAGDRLTIFAGTAGGASGSPWTAGSS